MSATQAASSTSEASELDSHPPNRSAVVSSTPNHTAASSSSPKSVSHPAAVLESDKAKQNGSAASSRHSTRIQEQPSSNTGPSAVTGSTSAPPQKRKQKGSASNFLSFLNCCGGSRHVNDIDLEEHAVPAQRSNHVQTAQSVPAKAQEASAAESSTAESKDISVERIGGTPYADLKSAGEPKIQEQSNAAPPAVIQEAQSIQGVEQTEGGSTNLGEAVVAIQPPSSNVSSDPKQPNSTGGDAPPSIPAEGEEVINDRTLQQEKADTDIEMTDAPPVEHVAAEESRGEGPQPDKTPPLPPPPPIVAQRQESSSRQLDTPAANQTNGPNDQQRWLLPPVKSEHKGRKCLVLDLDETLVHSSFKVSSNDCPQQKTLQR